uniref:Hemopexin n=1 Tax=Echeneis naucrates TaxID=173247 RepID=A0A665T4C5_ECHNA
MDITSKTLLLCFALGLVHGAPTAALPDRCAGIEFDAITPDENGVMFFFKGPHLWKGFSGPAQLSTESFKELDDLHDIGHVDAAFRMHSTEHADSHDHIYFFLDDKVFRYYNHTLEDGYPKGVQEEFPGVPTHLDSAVECPSGECLTDSVLFFKGNDVHAYDVATKTVKTKSWPHLPVCTSALRWKESHYCFNGHNFTKFNPVTGEVTGNYPKDARNYFMKCSGFGHGNSRKQKCSDIKLDAITSDDAGKTYLFAGPIYMRLDDIRDGLHPFLITRMWTEMTNGVDAVFSYSDRLYMIKDDLIYIYKPSVPYILIEGYPKTLKEELGIEGNVDAAFVCNNKHTVHVIQGEITERMHNVDLTATPRVVKQSFPLPITGIDAVQCSEGGVFVFKGSQYYEYESAMTMAMSRIAAIPNNITSEMMGCED